MAEIAAIIELTIANQNWIVFFWKYNGKVMAYIKNDNPTMVNAIHHKMAEGIFDKPDSVVNIPKSLKKFISNL